MWWYAALVAIAALNIPGEATRMEDTLHDLYDAPSEEQARFFLNYDQAAAFNTSVAFTIPLFSFTLPGAGDTSAAGMDLQSFGALAFVALFLLGGLGVAIYTTTQGSEGFGREFPYKHEESLLMTMVSESIDVLPNVVDTQSCAQLAICGAHSEPSRYGVLAWPVRFLVPSSEEIPDMELNDYQRAANYGSLAEFDCQYEYPCFVQPMDLLLYMYDYWYGQE